jgi:hypothetical protein
VLIDLLNREEDVKSKLYGVPDLLIFLSSSLPYGVIHLAMRCSIFDTLVKLSKIFIRDVKPKELHSFKEMTGPI